MITSTARVVDMRDIIVIGERNSGKSSFINYMTGMQVSEVSLISKSSTKQKYDCIEFCGSNFKIYEILLDFNTNQVSDYEKCDICFIVISALSIYNRNAFSLLDDPKLVKCSKMSIVISNMDRVDTTEVKKVINKALTDRQLSHAIVFYSDFATGTVSGSVCEFLGVKNECSSYDANTIKTISLASSYLENTFCKVDSSSITGTDNYYFDSTPFEKIVIKNYDRMLDHKIAEISNAAFCRKEFSTQSSALSWVQNVTNSLNSSDELMINLLNKNLIDGKNAELNEIKRKLIHGRYVDNKTWYNVVLPKDELIEANIRARINTSKLRDIHNDFKSSLISEVEKIPKIMRWGEKLKIRIFAGIPIGLVMTVVLLKLLEVFMSNKAYDDSSPLVTGFNSLMELREKVVNDLTTMLPNWLLIIIYIALPIVLLIGWYEFAKKVANDSVTRKIEAAAPVVRNHIEKIKEASIRSIIDYTTIVTKESREYYINEYANLFNDLPRF